jgi:hypothetical protein
MRYCIFLLLLLFVHQFSLGQKSSAASKAVTIDLTDFCNAAHHWCDISEKSVIISPRAGLQTIS